MSDTTTARPGFWRRQFSAEVTYRQMEFDALLGIIAPILCLFFDPIVFRLCDRPFCLSQYPGHRHFAYISIAIGMMILAAHLWARRLRTNEIWLICVPGILLYGVLFAVTIGVLIFPISLFGIILYGIGLLGFIPFVTAFVFLRNGVRAFRRAREIAPGQRRLLAAPIACAFATFAIPALIQWVLWQNGIR